MADELVEIMVYLQSSAPLSLNISRLMIRFVKEVHTYIMLMCTVNHKLMLGIQPNVYP